MTLHAIKKQTMSTQTNTEDLQAQTYSALIDGELSDDMANHSINQLMRSPAARAQYVQYIAIGDAMRGLTQPNTGFTDHVMAALEKQPVVLAPMPKRNDRRPMLWLAAATVTAISWSLWQSGPRDDLRDNISPPMATLQPPTIYLDDSQPYLAAHQDFAQAVVSAPEMRFSKATLEVRQ
jgi:hypothetical protein